MLYPLLLNSYFPAATIFAYGQTSSGKTFTMRGITEYAVNDIFEHIKNVTYLNLFVSFFFFILYRLLDQIIFQFNSTILCCRRQREIFF